MGYKSLWTQCERWELGNMISYISTQREGNNKIKTDYNKRTMKKNGRKLKTLQTYFTHAQS